ncbi:hypothetical protein GCM10009540_36780 [Streptomyces turgidiscabies]
MRHPPPSRRPRRRPAESASFAQGICTEPTGTRPQVAAAAPNWWRGTSNPLGWGLADLAPSELDPVEGIKS